MEPSETFFPALGEKEVVLFEETAESGGGERDAVVSLQQDGKFVLAPGGKALAEGNDFVHGSVGKG